MELNRNRGLHLLLSGLLFLMVFGIACSNSNRDISDRPVNPADIPTTQTTGSGLFAIECNIDRGYVPLLNSPDPGTGNGRVAVLDLSVDPDVTDPRLPSVVLSHADNPTGAAADPDDDLILIVSGRSGQGGFLDLIDSTNNMLTSDSPIPFPVGSEPGRTGQILYDPIGRVAVMSVTSNGACPAGPFDASCQGFVTFDPGTRRFSAVVPANYAETFAYNSATNVVIDASESDRSGEIGLVDLTARQNCVLADSNIGSDNDGASVDFNTNIVVISNEDGTATVVNLRGSTFNGSPPNCTVDEGGTFPNSVLLTGLPRFTAGSAVDPERHQAFLIEDGGDGITLVGLPSMPVDQLMPSMITQQVSMIPRAPDSSAFRTQGDPYAVAIDVCNNRGYAVDFQSRWLARIDLAALANDPASISTPLLSGNCAGTTTQLSCKNGMGVQFLPLPPVD